MADTAIDEPVDAEVVDDGQEEGPTRALARREEPTLTVAPQVAAEELGKRLQTIKQAMENEMQPEVDYGVIPGTNSKPTLLKPGAEKLAVLFQLDVQLTNEKVWGADDHLTVVSHATVYHAPTGSRLGYGEGVCSTREKKYAYRNAQRTCPECGKPTVFKSRKNDGEGFYCWRKKDGCGAQFAADDQRVASQEVGQVDNPDLPDTWNTVVKMAEKRARVDAILAVTGASALFTQDVEDHASGNGSQPPQAAGRTFGVEMSDSIKGDASSAAVVLCGDNTAARALLADLKRQFDGYMPSAAAITLVKAATMAQRARAARQANAEAARRTDQGAASPEDLRELEDRVYDAWLRVKGIGEQSARKKVDDCHGNQGALQLSLEAAETTLAKSQEVGR